jgi:ribonuclease Z
MEQVHHKLRAYSWNLAPGYPCDLVLQVTEVDRCSVQTTVRLCLKNAFAQEPVTRGGPANLILYDGPTFRVKTAVLDHKIACLAFAIEEAVHVNVWKSRLARAGLPVGPWLRDLKRAVTDNLPDHHLIRIGAPKPDPNAPTMPLGALREVVTVTPGQKIAYVTDVADTPGNRRAIVDLARNADMLFIEAAFAQSDADLAHARAHLTTTAAGQIARAAAVRRIEPFHFSPRYAGEDERLLAEVRAAFGGALRPT